MLLGLQLSTASLQAIASMDDSIVAVSASLARDAGVFPELPPSVVWASWFESGWFRGAHWLFTFEAYSRDWLPDSVELSDLKHDPSSAFLKAEGVSFIQKYDLNAVLSQESGAMWAGDSAGYL